MATPPKKSASVPAGPRSEPGTVAGSPATSIGGPTRRRRFLIAASLLMTFSGLVFAFGMALWANQKHTPPWVDWATYADALQRFLSGGSLYDARQLSGAYRLPEILTIGYLYPPPSLPLFALFTNQSIGPGPWLGLNVGLLVSGVFAILRRELGSDAILYLGVAILPVVLWVGFIEGVTAGNVTVGLSGVLAWAWAIGRGRTAPVWIAVVGMAKVFPAILVCWTTPPRLLRSVAMAGLIAGAWVLVTLPFLGIGTWVDFFRAMANAGPTCQSYGPSVTCVLQPVVGLAAAKIAGYVLAGALGLGAVFVRNDLIAFSMIALAWVVPVSDLSMYSMLPLFVVWVVVFAVAMRHLRSMQGSPSVAWRRLTERVAGRA